MRPHAGSRRGEGRGVVLDLVQDPRCVLHKHALRRDAASATIICRSKRVSPAVAIPVTFGYVLSTHVTAALMWRCSSNGAYHVSYRCCSSSCQLRRAMVLMVISAVSRAPTASSSPEKSAAYIASLAS